MPRKTRFLDRGRQAAALGRPPGLVAQHLGGQFGEGILIAHGEPLQYLAGQAVAVAAAVKGDGG